MRDPRPERQWRPRPLPPVRARCRGRRRDGVRGTAGRDSRGSRLGGRASAGPRLGRERGGGHAVSPARPRPEAPRGTRGRRGKARLRRLGRPAPPGDRSLARGAPGRVAPRSRRRGHPEDRPLDRAISLVRRGVAELTGRSVLQRQHAGRRGGGGTARGAAPGPVTRNLIRGCRRMIP